MHSWRFIGTPKRPYEGIKEMLLMENVEDKEYLTDLFKAIYDELAAPKPKKKKWCVEENLSVLDD